MNLKKLELKNFRNHANLTIELPKYLKIEGPNGSGKSSILEAIHLTATTKSPRTNRITELIKHGTSFAQVRVSKDQKDSMFDDELEMIIAINPKTDRATRVARINKTKKSLNEFAGSFNSVLFTPEDLNILLGAPSERRRWIDTLLFQISASYRVSTTRYIQALKKRNKMLEAIAERAANKAQLGFWDEELLKNSFIIVEKRKELFEFIKEILETTTKTLSPTGYNYLINYSPKELSEELFEEYYPKEIRAKRTLVGPHLDDFETYLNNENVQKFGSRGQQRTLVLALKLCELKFIKEKTKEDPILLLDDIMSELDIQHQQAVENIVNEQQTIITTAHTEKEELFFS